MCPKRNKETQTIPTSNGSLWLQEHTETEEDATDIIPDPDESERLAREHDARGAAWKRGEFRRRVESFSREIRRAMKEGKQSISRLDGRDDATAILALDIVVGNMKQRGYSQARLYEKTAAGGSAYTRWVLR